MNGSCGAINPLGNLEDQCAVIEPLASNSADVKMSTDATEGNRSLVTKEDASKKTRDLLLKIHNTWDNPGINSQFISESMRENIED